MFKHNLVITLFAEYGLLGREYRPVWHTETSDVFYNGSWQERALFEIPEKWEPCTKFWAGKAYTLVKINGSLWNLDDVLTTDRHGRPAITVPGRGGRKCYTLKSA